MLESAPVLYKSDYIKQQDAFNLAPDNLSLLTVLLLKHTDTRPATVCVTSDICDSVTLSGVIRIILIR